MPHLSFEAINYALEEANRPKWQWVVDGDDCVYADKDNPPTHELSGHWEYVPTTREHFEVENPFTHYFINKVLNK